jgi:hypothetical protein
LLEQEKAADKQLPATPATPEPTTSALLKQDHNQQQQQQQSSVGDMKQPLGEAQQQQQQQQQQHVSGLLLPGASLDVQAVLRGRLKLTYGYSLAGRGLLQLLRGLPPYRDWVSG